MKTRLIFGVIISIILLSNFILAESCYDSDLGENPYEKGIVDYTDNTGSQWDPIEERCRIAVTPSGSFSTTQINVDSCLGIND